jgi:hypothetical protein
MLFGFVVDPDSVKRNRGLVIFRDLRSKGAAKSRENQMKIVSGVTVAVAWVFLHHDLHRKNSSGFIGITLATRPPKIGFGPGLNLCNSLKRRRVSLKSKPCARTTALP